jgi:hypothetical protein
MNFSEGSRVIQRNHSMFNYVFARCDCSNLPEIEIMANPEQRDVWKQSLSAMMASLESSYDFKTIVQEESQLIQGLRDVKKDYIIFSGYRRNAGRRRLNDVKNVIDTALEKIGNCKSREATRIYLETLKAVTMQTRWVAILEQMSQNDLVIH